MASAKLSVAELEKFLLEEFPQVFKDGDVTIESADGETCLRASAIMRKCCGRAARCRALR